MVDDGTLAVGAALPSTRSLAERLGVAANTLDEDFPTFARVLPVRLHGSRFREKDQR